MASILEFLPIPDLLNIRQANRKIHISSYYAIRNNIQRVQDLDLQSSKTEMKDLHDQLQPVLSKYQFEYLATQTEYGDPFLSISRKA